MHTENMIHLTEDLPTTVYALTARNCVKYSPEEQKARAVELAQILGVEVDVENYTEFDDGVLQFTPKNGGTIETATSARYWGYDAFAAEAEQEGRAKQVARFTITEGTELNQSYPLNGVDYSIAEAINYISALWEESLAHFSNQPDISIERVIVYQWEDDHYSYVFLLSHEYDGVPFEQYSTFAQMIYESGGFRKTYVLMEMDAPEHLSVFSDHYPTEIIAADPIEQPLMTEDTALQRAHAVMASYSNVSVLESQLCYGAYRSRDTDTTDAEWNTATYVYRPYWCFVLEWADDNDGNFLGSGWTNYTPNVTLYIDAVTGTAYLLDSINSTEIQISQ